MFVPPKVDIGDIYEIEVSSDNAGLCSSWFLESITIEQMKVNKPYEFAANAWFGEDRPWAATNALSSSLNVTWPIRFSLAEILSLAGATGGGRTMISGRTKCVQGHVSPTSRFQRPYRRDSSALNQYISPF